MKKIVLVVVILFATNSLRAQWVSQNSNITAGFYAPFIDAVDQDVCWGLVADPLAQLNPVQEYTRTIDGGLNWAGGAITNCPGRCPSSISAINGDTAWVAMFSGTGGPGKGAIMRTNDGGLTWTQQDTTMFSLPGNFPDFIYFWDANNGMCLGDPTTGYFEIYTTTNGGINWSRSSQAEIPVILPNEFGITDVFTADNGSTLWFGTNFGRIYKTMDRGHNWTVAQTPFTDFIGSIAFRDANNGLCTSGGTTGSLDVARTTDGGATWSLAGTNTAGMNLKNSICFVPGSDSTYFISTPFAGSVDGTTFSPNDGNAWIPVDNLIHTEVEFVNDSTGWTGSNELGAPMFKWSSPIVVALNDVSSQSVDVPVSTGLITQTPQATIMNNGLSVQSFNVTMTITGGYTSTKSVSNLAFYNTVQVDFDPWTPAAIGPYTINIYTSLGTDSNRNNDSLTKTVNVFETFSNCGWVAKPNVVAGTFGLGDAFYLDGWTSTAPGTLYSLGGTTLAGSVATNNTFSTLTQSWSAGVDMPSPKVHFSAQVANKKIICSGGYSGGFTPDATTYIYDIANSIWTTGTPMPTPVGDYACGMYKDSLIYYINGYNDVLGDQNLVQIYDVYNDTWSNGTLCPVGATEGSRGAINGNKFIFVGGYSGSVGGPIADAYVGDIDILNPTNITWTAIAPYPPGPIFRPAAGTVFMDFRPLALFVGGDPTVQTGADKIADCWAYDVNLNQWLIGPPKPSVVNNLMDFRGLIYNDTLWMAAIAGYDGVNPSKAQEWLCLGAQLWTGMNDHSSVSKNNSLTVYPNPVTDELTVVSENKNRKAMLSIVDVAGRIVFEQTMNAAVAKVNTQLLEPGVYSIRVSGDAGISNVKFVKQ